jgi:hypothetical protein
MAKPMSLGDLKCATCHGDKVVKLRDGTYVNCLPCSLPLHPLITQNDDDAPGAAVTGPGDASEESTQ